MEVNSEDNASAQAKSCCSFQSYADESSLQYNERVHLLLAQKYNKRHIWWSETDRAKYLSFKVLGTSKQAIPARLLMMWLFGIPILVIRFCLILLISFFFVGLFTGGICVVVVGGTVAQQAVYRDVLRWAGQNDVFQDFWNTTAEVIATTINFAIRILRAFLEIWNGLVPFISLLIEPIFELMKQIAMMLFGQPILQYFIMLAIRFVFITLEYAMDFFMCLMEIFMFLADDFFTNFVPLVVNEMKNAAVDSAGRTAGAFQNRRNAFDELSEAIDAGSVEDVISCSGDIALHILSVMLAVVVKIVCAWMRVLLPLFYSLFRLVLPKVFKYIPPAIEIVANMASMLISDPVMRVLNYLIKAIPIVIEFVAAFVCSVLTYLGAGFCYLIYGFCTLLSFVLRYVIRPLACGGNAILAGCFRSFIRASMSGNDCYQCGSYHTACGCSHNSVPSNGDCTSQCTNPSAANPSDDFSSFSNREEFETEMHTQFAANDNADIEKSQVHATLELQSTDPSDSSITHSTQTDYHLRRNFEQFVTTYDISSVCTYTASGTLYSTPTRHSYFTSNGTLKTSVHVGTFLPDDLELQCASGDLHELCSSATHQNNVELFIANYPSNVGSTLRSTPWLASGVNSAVFLDVRFPLPTQVYSLKAQWGSVAMRLCAPQSYSVFALDNAGNRAYSLGVFAFKKCNQTSRLDSLLVNQHSKGIPAIRLTDFIPCISQSLQHNIEYKLESLQTRVLDNDFEQLPATDLMSVTQMNLPCTQESQLGCNVMWDPCATHTCTQCIDKKRDLGTVFFPLESYLSIPFGIALKVHHKTKQSDIASFVVHLTATSQIDFKKAYLCTDCSVVSDTAFHTSAWNETCVRASNASIPMSKLERAPSLTFELPMKHKSDSHNSCLVFPAQSLCNARVSRWSTVQTEIDTLLAHSTTAAWMNQVHAHLTQDGKIAKSTAYQSVKRCYEPLVRQYGQDTTSSVEWVLQYQTAIENPRASKNVAVYSSPFGSLHESRPWVGIREIDITYKKIPNVSQQPEISDVQDENPDQMLDSLLAAELNNPSTAHVHHRLAQSKAAARGAQRRAVLQDFHGLHSSASQSQMHASVSSDDMFHSQTPDWLPEPKFIKPKHKEFTFNCQTMENNKMHCRHAVFPEISHVNKDTLTEHNQNNRNNFSTITNLAPSFLTSVKSELTRMQTLSAELESLKSSRNADATTRRIIGGSVSDAFSEADITKIAEDTAEELLDTFEAGICAAMQCGEYCGHDNNGCSDSSKLGDCIQGGVFYLIKTMFGCNQNQEVNECLTGPVISWVLKILDSLFDYALRLIDLVGNGVASILGIGNVLKLIACESCSLVTLAVGTLSDFIDDFDVDTCMTIMEKGTYQCSIWGLAGADAGAAVFENFLPLMKLAFGLVQTLPAFMELIVEFAIMFGGSAIEVFPDLLNDAFDILMWFIALSDQIESLETLLQAFDEAWDEVNDSGLFGSTDGSNRGFAEATTESAFAAAPESDLVHVHHESISSDLCLSSATSFNTSKTGNCRSAKPYNAHSSLKSASDARNSTVGSILNTSGVVDASSDMGMDLGDCGCSVPVQACAEGPGSINCRFQDSIANTKRLAKINASRAQTAANLYTHKDHWPMCADIDPPRICPDTGRYESNERVKAYNKEKRCYVFVRPTVSGGYVNNMNLDIMKQRFSAQVMDATVGNVEADIVTGALTDAAKLASLDASAIADVIDNTAVQTALQAGAIAEALSIGLDTIVSLAAVSGIQLSDDWLDSLVQTDFVTDTIDTVTEVTADAAARVLDWWPFVRFSKHTGEKTRMDDPDIDLAEMAFSNTPSNSEIHRRRRTTTESGRRLLYASHIMGVQEFFDPDYGTNEQPNFKPYMHKYNLTYANEMFRLLKEDSMTLVNGLFRLRTLVEKSSIGRRLMQFSNVADKAEENFERVVCTLKETDDSGILIPPNTYPCCKGAKLCIQPPFRRDYRFKKEWLIWQDRWVKNTECKEMENYVDGWLFTVRAFFKLIRTSDHHTEAIWPIVSLSNAMLDVVLFEEDKWPQELIHPNENHWPYTWTCFGLNIGIWVLSLIILCLLWAAVQQESFVRDILSAHCIIFVESFAKSAKPKPILDQVLDVPRQYTDRAKVVDSKDTFTEHEVAPQTSTPTNTKFTVP